MPDRPRLPIPPERPLFDFDEDAFDNDGPNEPPEIPGWPPRLPRDYDHDDGGRDDVGLFRVLGVMVVVAVIVVALVLPVSPIRVIGRGGGGSAGEGITAKPRGDLPALPGGLTAVSRLYDLSIPSGIEGTQVIEVALNEHVADGKSLLFYSYDGDSWKRLGVATLSADGKHASGELPFPPKSVAVLRATATARSLGLIVSSGQVPEARVLSGASVVAVRAATLGKDGKTITLRDGGLAPALKAANGKPVYLAIEPGSDAVGSPLGGDLAVSIAGTAKAAGVGGVLIDFGPLANEQRAAVSKFTADLGARLRADRLGLVVAVPAAGRDGGAYDWSAILASADGLWFVPRVDSGDYYSQVDATLDGAAEAGVDLARVSLVLDRRSQETSTGLRSMLTQREALALASTILRPPDNGVGGTATVSLTAPFLSGSGGGLRWDDTAKSVTFVFAEAGKAHAVWVENRFSATFRLDLASRRGLGGVVLDQAEANPALADLADIAAEFAQGNAPRLEQPFGPYLVPCWQAIGGGTIEGASACWTQDHAAPSAVWRTPKTGGVFTVRLVVSDGTSFVGQEIPIRVTPGGLAEPIGGINIPGTTTTAPTLTPTPTATAAVPTGPPGPGGN